MAYTDLKEKLEQLLSEDISNRATLQEARRSLFLNSEGSKVQQQLIDQKQSEIANLSTLVEKKKTIVQLKEDEIIALRDTVKQLEDKALAAEIGLEEERKLFGAKVAEMNGKVESSQDLENKLTELSLQNNEFTGKIRELIIHIDSQNEENERLKARISNIEGEKKEMVSASLLAERTAEVESLTNELLILKTTPAADSKELEQKNAELEAIKAELETLKASPVVDTKELEQKTAELEQALERADLLGTSEQQLKVLVSIQNADIESLNKLVSGHKRQIEDIAGGWQHQQEQLLADNSNLLAELTMLKEATVTMVVETPVATVTEEVITAIVAEKEQLNAQLQAATTELSTLKEDLGHQPAPVTSTTPEEVEVIKQERDRLCIELEATRYELDIVTQQKEEKIVLLQSEIGSLQTQVIALSDSLNQESEAKGLVGTQLEQLHSIVTEKERQLKSMADNAANDDFIDKLMFQANRLNDEKHRLEMLYTESEAELTLTRTNLATLSQLIEQQKTSISGLEETDKHVKLAQTLMLQVSDKTAAKQAINELVREIDRCIALLSE